MAIIRQLACRRNYGSCPVVGSDDSGERAALIYGLNGTVSSRTWLAREVCVTSSSASPGGLLRPEDKTAGPRIVNAPSPGAYAAIASRRIAPRTPGGPPQNL